MSEKAILFSLREAERGRMKIVDDGTKKLRFAYWGFERMCFRESQLYIIPYLFFFFHGFCCCLNCASFASNILTLLNHSYLINYQSFSQTKVKTKTMHAACPNKQCNHCFLLVLSRMFHQNVQGIISYISYLNREQSN